jgi:hypothetical protein
MTTEDNMLTAASDLRHAAPLAADARRQLEDQRRGLPGSALGGNGGGHTSSSPVESALGLNNPADPHGYTLPHDRAAQALTELAELEKRLKRDAYRYRVLVTAAAARPADAKARREAERANSGDKLCEHCTPWMRPGNVEPVFVTGDVLGNLPDPKGLCKWCWRFVRNHARLPSQSEVERHDNGQRIRVPTS